MKILLDENIPHSFRALIHGHEVATALYAGLCGIRNGDLLRRAAALGFDVVITMDRGMAHQHNQATLPVGVVVLLAPGNTIDDLRPLVPARLEALASLPPRALIALPR